MLDALGQTSTHVYSDAAVGRVAGEATRRVEHSSALAAAVEREEPFATRVVLQGLLKGQILAIRVLRGSHLLAAIGAANALAPIRGSVRNAQGEIVGSFVLSVYTVRDYADLLRSLTRAQVLTSSAGHRPAQAALGPGQAEAPSFEEVVRQGRHHHAYAFTGEAFPFGRLRITLLLGKPSPSMCGSTTAETIADTIGAVGRRIYQGELAGASATAALRLAEHSAALRTAVARDDPAGARAAIKEFFSSHLYSHFHIVRVRAMLGSRLVADLGGPFVLAPVPGTLSDSAGRPFGRFLLSVQDDQGYVILAHNFTGAQVILRAGKRQVPWSTLNPGPAVIPERGQVEYRGIGYQAFSFSAQAFPSGPLRISLLVPNSGMRGI